MDPKIIKKTQDTLGKAIKKPPLTDKLLSKPPFRFLHDVFTSVIKTTGFMKGLFSEKELNSENIKDRDSKIAFLQKAIDFVSMVTGKSLAVRPQKIVAGSEPEKTNEFLQALAEAIKLKVNNEEYVKRFNKAPSDEGEERIDPEKDGEKKKHRSDVDRERRNKDKDRHKSHEREKDSSRERGDGVKEAKSGESVRDKDGGREKDRERKSKRKGESGKENQHPVESPKEQQKPEKQESPARIPRPTSAKGSRRRREGRNESDEEDELFQQKPSHDSENTIGEGDLPPQVVAARKLQRPPSARPAPPRPKQDGMESEPAMRLGTGKPANVIVDTGKQSDDDDDDNFIVEESAPPPVEHDQHLPKPEIEDDTEHGALVKKMLETKKEFEEQPQGPVKKTEIERPSMSDAARRKQREMVKKEVEKICSSIQSLTRSANPLGKIMDFVQEDLDSMQKELEKWKAENKEHALELKRESGITDRSIEPLKAQLTELEQAISDKLDLIAATKAKIIKNDSKIEKMLMSMSKS